MSDLMMVVTENIPPSLRGRLSLWLVEIRSGVYAGVYSVKVREYIWENIVSAMQRRRSGNVIMVWKDRNDLGFSVRSLGKSNWSPRDFDGMTLMSYQSNTISDTSFMPSDNL